MNHAEQAAQLLARFHEGQGSDQAAIAHALLAINDTLATAAAELNIEVPPFDETEASLADLNQRRLAAVLGLADEWESNRDAGSMSFRYAAGKLRHCFSSPPPPAMETDDTEIIPVPRWGR